MNPSKNAPKCPEGGGGWGVMGPVGILESFQWLSEGNDKCRTSGQSLQRVHVNDEIFKGPGKANIECRHHCSLHRQASTRSEKGILEGSPKKWHWWVEDHMEIYGIWIFPWRLMLGRWFISPLNMLPFQDLFRVDIRSFWLFSGVDKYVVNLCDSGIPIWCEF